MATLARKVAGHVAAIEVRNGDRVRAGDVVVRLDDGDLVLAIEAARGRIASQEATVARLSRQADAARSAAEQVLADIAGARAALGLASAEFARYAALAARDFASRSRLDQAQAERHRAAAVLASAEAALATARAHRRGRRRDGRGRAPAVGIRRRARAGRARSGLRRDPRALRRHGREPRGAAGRMGSARRAAAVARPGARPLDRRQLQGDAARQAAARPARAHRGRGPARRADRRVGRRPVARLRRGLQPAAARERDRQLHQDRPARAGAHRRARRCRRGRAAAPGPVGRGAHRHARPRRRARIRRGGRAPMIPAGAATGADAGIRPRRLLAFLAMVFGMFMAILDIQIVSASLTEIQAGLAASADEIAYVQTSYLITEVIMIPLSGFLSRIVSTRWMFTFSAGGFTIASFLCGTATTIEKMVLWRAVQGFVSGGMIPTNFAASYAMFPPSPRARIMPLRGLVVPFAPTIEPTVGGWLTEMFSWHWLFYVNIVPGILVTIVGALLIDHDRPNWALFGDFDWWGLASKAVFLGSLQCVLEEGPLRDWFDSEVVTGFAALAVAAGLLFFARVLSVTEPIVDLRAFANRNFALGSMFSLVTGVGL
ncbi:MAG: DHA2 family efflux MFS transporter permease subunit, partial [Alphaproteobacteria bacterium]|nr:DHA2 family efflux MFS transporter permease subunit [Alphaproteobacteria bacterium]